jgi:hypothetical protein
VIPLNEAIIVALITGAAAIISNVLTSNKAAREMDYKLEKHQAVTDTKIEELTREVREHNNFARRTPVLEQEMADVKATVKTLQGYHMN